MSKIVVILLATSTGLGLLSLHLVRQMHAGQATITELRAQVAALERLQENRRAQLPSFAPLPPPGPAEVGNDSGRASSALSKEVAAMGSSVKATTPADVAQPQLPSREERMRMMRDSHDRQRALMQDPEYRDAMRLQNRSNFARANPGLAAELGFDQQQTDEFLELLSDQQLRASDVLQPMWDLEGKDQVTIEAQQRKIQQQSLQLQRTGAAEIAARFGQDKLRAWQEYQSTLGVRHQLEQMRTSLASQGMPIGEDMNRAMVKAMVEAQKAEADEYSAVLDRDADPATPRVTFAPGGGLTSEMADRQIEATKKRNQRTLDALSPYLTHEQRQAIEREQEAQLKLQQAHMRIMRSQGAGNDSAAYVSGSASQVMVPAQ